MSRRALTFLVGATLAVAGGGVAAGFALTGNGDGDREAAGERPAAAKRRTPPSAADFGTLAVGWRTDFSKRSVPPGEVQSGGAGKDGIPAIDRPRFAPVARTSYLKPQEPVVSLVVNGQARAYPLQILIWHEIVNDRVGGVPVAVTFCPLCNTAIVFDARLRGERLTFGTTGNLRNSDLVMYDRKTESWWQQFGGEAVVGTLTGARLRQLPARIVSWSEFKRDHPRGLVLTRDTGFARPFGEYPYTGYDDVNTPPFFPVKNLGDKRLPPKERVVYIERGDEAVAIPFSALARKRVMRVVVGGHKLVVRFTGKAASALDTADIPSGRRVGTAEVRENGRLVPFSEPFWFSVAALQPKVVVKS